MKLINIIALLVTIDKLIAEPINTCLEQSHCFALVFEVDEEPEEPVKPDRLCLIANLGDAENPQCQKDAVGECLSWGCADNPGEQETQFCDGVKKCVDIQCVDPWIARFLIKDGSNHADDKECGVIEDAFVVSLPSGGNNAINGACKAADSDLCDGNNCGGQGSCEQACVWEFNYKDFCQCPDCVASIVGSIAVSIGINAFIPQIQTGEANSNGEISHNNAFKTNSNSNNTAVGDISVNHLVIIIFCVFIVIAVIAGFVYYYVRVIKDRKFMKKVMSNVIINDEAEVAEQQNQMHMECESITNTPTSQNDNTNDKEN